MARRLLFLAVLSPLLVLVVVPILQFLALSFATLEDGRIDCTPSLANFREILGNPSYARVIWQTLLICTGVMATTILVGYPVAYFIWTRSRRAATAWLVVFSLPLLMSYIVKIYTVRSILGMGGPLNTLLVATGLLDRPSALILHNRLAIYLTMSVILLPFVILPIYLSLCRIERTLLSAASDLGATPASVFRHVTLPLTAPGAAAGGLFAFVLALGDYITPQMVGGPGGFTIGRVVWSQFGLAFNWPFGAALGIVVLFPAVAAISLAALLAGRRHGR